MNKEQALKTAIFSIMALAFVSGAFAREEAEMIAKPASHLSVAAFTQGMSFIIAGGIGPILILVIAFVVGMVVSHVIWGGF